MIIELLNESVTTYKDICILSDIELNILFKDIIKKTLSDNLNLKCIYNHYYNKCSLCYQCIGDIYIDKIELFNNNNDYDVYQDMYSDYAINVLGRKSVY